MRTLYFDCFSGISGDMTLGALLGIGLPEEKLRGELAKLGVGFALEIFPGSRNGIAAWGVEVKPEPHGHHHHHPHGHFGEIRKLIETSPLSPEVKRLSLAIFQKVAEAEAKVHNKPIAEVHFHEVGAIDSIVDIVGTAIGIDHFKPARIVSSELPMGWGFVQCQHGRLPLPAPATLEILKGYAVKSANVEGELVTPTGAAIIAALSSGAESFPAMKVETVGYGMGKKEFPDRPNLLRLVLGETTNARQTDRVIVLEANIDDMNPEFYDYLMERLFNGGALDVALSPLQMKKNRPGTLLRVIAREPDGDRLTDLILRESTTLGVRAYPAERKKLERSVREVDTRFGKVKVKVSGNVRFQPEYDDCRRIALEREVPIQEVYEEAKRMARN
jgi:uncharacterized protein (TIGR00299 family) protein